jgi:hypothetical protein
VIIERSNWRLEHVLEPVPMAGWLILNPLLHVELFADLTAEEAAAFGVLAQRATKAMQRVLAPVKVYVVLFAEAYNAAHLHSSDPAFSSTRRPNDEVRAVSSCSVKRTPSSVTWSRSPTFSVLWLRCERHSQK